MVVGKFEDWNFRAKDVTEHLTRNLKMDLDSAEALARLKASYPVMPWHSDEARVSPNDILRCGLFGVTQRTAARLALHRHRYELQASRGGYIEYTGQELRQSDGDVLMGLFHLEQATPGVAVARLRSLASGVGFGTSNDAVRRVEDAIIRMSASNVEINSFWMSKSGEGRQLQAAFSLITGYRVCKPGVWAVYLSEELRALAENNRYTRVCYGYLRKLNRGATLASWLLKFYSTHKVPKEFDISEFHKLCGSLAERKEFKRMLIGALEHLKELGFLEHFEVIGTNLRVVRKLVDGIEQESA